MKTCTRCQETKEKAEFRRNRRCRDGLSSWCSTCHNAATRSWRKRNPEYVAAYNEGRRADPLPPWARALANRPRGADAMSKNQRDVAPLVDRDARRVRSRARVVPQRTQ